MTSGELVSMCNYRLMPLPRAIRSVMCIIRKKPSVEDLHG